MNIYKKIRPLIFMLPPELAHDVATKILKYLPSQDAFLHPVLKNTIYNITFATPIGIAAGFDKNGTCIGALFNQGLGFVEIGTVTPLAQSGNPKPRMFRLEEDEAMINSMGFNNKGIDFLVEKISAIQRPSGPIGINIGKNKNGTINDYIVCLEKAYPLADYIAINISSPNTKGLREIQNKNELTRLLDLLIDKKNSLIVKFHKNVPLFLKISPDNTMETQIAIAELVLKYNIEGLIVSNTTVNHRENLHSEMKNAKGGLSGRPLNSISDEAIKNMYTLTKGKIPIIGSGGVFSTEDAYRKIKLGASLIQLYTGIIYEGFNLVKKIQKELTILLRKDGFDNIKNAIGSDNNLS